MKRLVQALAIAAALAASPALADDADPLPGFDRDPFSQAYDGGPPPEARADPERAATHGDASPGDRSCRCGHGSADRQPAKA